MTIVVDISILWYKKSTINRENKMKYVISYYSIEYGAHIFATPSFTNSELVEGTKKQVEERILSKVDAYDNSFKRATKEEEKMFGYKFTSHTGAATYEKYVKPTEPKVIKL